IQTAPGTDPAAVRNELAAEHPEYTFRTNQEQLVSLVERQAVVLAAGVSLVGLGVIAGGILSLNILLSMIYIQRRSLSILRAVGATRRSVIGIALVESLAIAAAGYLLAIAVTPLLAAGLNRLALVVTGFEGLVEVPTYAYLAGAGVAFAFALLGGTLGAWRVGRLASVSALER
ncbi:ABC transporter permease, partial [Halorubrum sp. Atlit-26R]|uniref:ABC transporter permease n=1 Tax=Halorubrum sp. Atlit-26R TaxID=2282128 RepID=UPI000F153B1B